ncbi:MAG: ABC transporter permease [Planctomycetes bacterium]|nr:ABC transporter permease [Planctomycetota bacterium]
MANKTLLVAQREYLDNVRTKTFWLGILAFPVLLVISIGAGWVLNKLKETQSYAVLDPTEDRLGERIERAARTPEVTAFAKLLQDQAKQLPESLQGRRQGLLDGFGGDPQAPNEEAVQRLQKLMLDLPASDLDAAMRANKGFDSARKYQRRKLADLGLEGKPLDEQRKALAELVQKGTLFAYFEIGTDPLRSLADFKYVSNNLTDDALRSWYADAATRVVQKLRLASSGVDPAVAKQLQERVYFREQKVGSSGAAEDVKTGEKANKFAPVAFVYLLWIAVFTAAQMLLTNTVEEKSNRIIEVLLSSVSPLQLMAGKIWGIAATGLTIVGSWVLCALFGVWLAPRLITGLDLPLLDIVGNPLYLISFVVYFFFGYLLYAAILVGLGSVCNSLKEAQNLLQPVFLLLIVPLVSMMFIVQEPNGTVAKVLSYVPLFTPFTMMNRAGGPPEVYEYVVTGLILVVSVVVAFRAAGKVFRVGILMTGNPPKLKEVLGWLRAG